MELGFEHIGFAKYQQLEDESRKLQSWLNNGYDADMAWIKKGFDKRKDIKNIMPDAKSVISLAYNYYTPFEHDESKPKISRYAWGKDYHKILKKKLKEICNCIEQTSPYPLLSKEGTKNSLHLSKVETGKNFPIEKVETGNSLPLNKEEYDGVLCKSYVDDGPVMDKAWAVKAGLGWQGKHSNVINPDFGSWFFICTIITNIEFDSYSSRIEDQCGSCTLCISACPTGAIVNEYVVDSNKCISYHTIENRADIPAEINLDGWIFGCDVCQDVCPYNAPKFNRVTKENGFYPQVISLPLDKGECPKDEGVKTSPYPRLSKEETKDNSLSTEDIFKSKEQLEQITEEEFTAIFADSPIKRTKYKGWKRNLEVLPPSQSPPEGGR